MKLNKQPDLKNRINCHFEPLGGRTIGSHLYPNHLFMSLYNDIPCSICEGDLDMEKVTNLFEKQIENKIEKTYYSRRPFKSNEISKMDDVYHIMKEGYICYVNYNNEDVTILFSHEKEQEIKEVHNLIIRLILPKQKEQPHIDVIYSGEHGLQTRSLPLKNIALDIELNYNDDFSSTHSTIIKRLKIDNDKGLVLLHGVPGTGKTTYIKYLISQVEKQVIFMPPSIAGNLNNPELMKLLMEHTNSVLVIEDAERLVANRNINSNSPVSAILNLSDGLLSDCLNIQIICSFNTDLQNVDKALLRKGRLIAKYEFNKLSTDKSNQLSLKLGFNSVFHQPQRLTDIYNQKEKSFKSKPSRVIGFG